MNWDAIRKEYESSDITLKALAEKHEIKLGTLKSRKSREGWERATEKDATRKRATSKKKDAPKGKPHRAPKGNKYAVGNKGNPNPTPKFAKRNTESVKHGLFSKYLPQETLDIMQELETKSTADMIWDQIVIQYTAIIRAQKIMFVTDQEDMTREVKKEKYSDSGSETEWEIQFAWDKHASFMNAQSRAMSELRSLIKQFDEIAHIEDERRLKLDIMGQQVKKLKRENETSSSTEDKLSKLFDAIEGEYLER
ncbi:phage terminase small subunit [Priestia sp. FSL R5-0597]|uniref:phage terminase small subunit n=1 Tax=Priestia sp. FSL R5-0597 TaxID=2921580 RepID=UPI0030FA4E6B